MGEEEEDEEEDEPYYSLRCVATAGITRDLEPYANLKPGEKPVIAGVCEQGTTIQVLGKAVTAEGQVRFRTRVSSDGTIGWVSAVSSNGTTLFEQLDDYKL